VCVCVCDLISKKVHWSAGKQLGIYVKLILQKIRWDVLRSLPMKVEEKVQTWQSLKLPQDQGTMTNRIQSWQTSSRLHILIYLLVFPFPSDLY
jgi:hypothetical protein